MKTQRFGNKHYLSPDIKKKIEEEEKENNDE